MGVNAHRNNEVRENILLARKRGAGVAHFGAHKLQKSARIFSRTTWGLLDLTAWEHEKYKKNTNIAFLSGWAVRFVAKNGVFLAKF